MPSESLHDTPIPNETIESADPSDPRVGPDPEGELPAELSEFNQRLASFGLGEAPDPLLTQAEPTKPRQRP
jgi:hypothetical protein